MDLAKDSLLLKRKVLNTNMERGLYPYTQRYLQNFNRHFSTIGLVGTNECCLNLLGKGIESNEGKAFAEKILTFMRDKVEKYTKETGHLFNLEATPAEGASYRLAKLDKEKYPNIITWGEEVPIYTNSTHLPVDFSDDLFEVLDHQDSLQTKYTSGTVLHVFTGERLEGEGTATLVKKIVHNYKLPYFSITPTFSICPTHKYMTGSFPECPHCGNECSIYSRIVGYLRPVNDWNIGKKEEFKLRKEYKL
jgi:ribonucleoside-triphosphate reductase